MALRTSEFSQYDLIVEFFLALLNLPQPACVATRLWSSFPFSFCFFANLRWRKGEKEFLHLLPLMQGRVYDPASSSVAAAAAARASPAAPAAAGGSWGRPASGEAHCLLQNIRRHCLCPPLLAQLSLPTIFSSTSAANSPPKSYPRSRV